MCLKMRKCAKSGESIRKYANLEQDCLLLFLKYNYFFWLALQKSAAIYGC